MKAVMIGAQNVDKIKGVIETAASAFTSGSSTSSDEQQPQASGGKPSMTQDLIDMCLKAAKLRSKVMQ